LDKWTVITQIYIYIGRERERGQTNQNDRENTIMSSKSEEEGKYSYPTKENSHCQGYKMHIIAN
jgi:hypothetical protein